MKHTQITVEKFDDAEKWNYRVLISSFDDVEIRSGFATDEEIKNLPVFIEKVTQDGAQTA